MKRFGASDRGSVLRELVRPVLLFVLVLAVLLVGIGRLNAASLEEELATAEEAVRRAAVQCYAVEGSYPPNLTISRNTTALRWTKAALSSTTSLWAPT